MVDKTEADNDSEGGELSIEQKRNQHKQLLREVIRTSKDVNNSVESLIEKIGSGPDMSDGISFLDLKNDLMINYNLNLLFLLMKKTRDGKIETERAAVERLCYLRTVLEKNINIITISSIYNKLHRENAGHLSAQRNSCSSVGKHSGNKH